MGSIISYSYFKLSTGFAKAALQDFAYRVDFGMSTFLWVGGLAFCVVILTVSFQSFKAALANPVDSLKYE